MNAFTCFCVASRPAICCSCVWDDEEILLTTLSQTLLLIPRILDFNADKSTQKLFYRRMLLCKLVKLKFCGFWIQLIGNQKGFLCDFWKFLFIAKLTGHKTIVVVYFLKSTVCDICCSSKFQCRQPLFYEQRNTFFYDLQTWIEN